MKYAHGITTLNSYPHDWPFVWEIQPWMSLTRSQKCRADVYFEVSLNKLLNKHTSWRWFEMPWCPCGITTVYPKKYAHGFCFAVLCCGYTLTDFPISIRLTSLALWQSNDCPSASKATLMNMDKYFMWIHYERLHNHNKAMHNETVCIFLGIYCITSLGFVMFCCGLTYSISQEICTWFRCALHCCGYAIVHNEFTWSIYPYSSGLLCWHWGNR